MDKILKNKKGRGGVIVFFLVAILAFAFMLWNQHPNIPNVQAAGKSGDRLWTDAPAPAYFDTGQISGRGVTRGVAFPYDGNSQPAIVFIEASIDAKGDYIGVFAYDSRVTDYQVTTVAFCGGNTKYIHAPNGMQTNGSVTSGNSYFALDDGAGNVGWGMFSDKTAAGTGDIITVSTGGSNFATRPEGAPAIQLSGVTFPAGSRVYPLRKIGDFGYKEPISGVTIWNASNASGIYAAPKNSPLAVIYTTNGTGVTLFGVNAKYL